MGNEHYFELKQQQQKLREFQAAAEKKQQLMLLRQSLEEKIALLAEELDKLLKTNLTSQNIPFDLLNKLDPESMQSFIKTLNHKMQTLDHQIDDLEFLLEDSQEKIENNIEQLRLEISPHESSSLHTIKQSLTSRQQALIIIADILSLIQKIAECLSYIYQERAKFRGFKLLISLISSRPVHNILLTLKELNNLCTSSIALLKEFEVRYGTSHLNQRIETLIEFLKDIQQPYLERWSFKSLDLMLAKSVNRINEFINLWLSIKEKISCEVKEAKGDYQHWLLAEQNNP